MESENFNSDINILELHRVGEINVEICKREELSYIVDRRHSDPCFLRQWL
jgi:hypothetical protein